MCWSVSTLSSHSGHVCVCDNVPSATSPSLLPSFLWEVNLDSENRKKGPPCDSKTRRLILDSYTHTRPCPCFLQSVQRTPLNPSPQGNRVRGRAGRGAPPLDALQSARRLRRQTGPDHRQHQNMWERLFFHFHIPPIPQCGKQKRKRRAELML